MNLEKISRAISYILRHHPEEFGLIIDEQGWVDFMQLFYALKERSFNYLKLTDFIKSIEQDEKNRYEIQDNLIRARYGHSFPTKMYKEKSTPPLILYHSTNALSKDAIAEKGLLPMKRQYVHLTSSFEDAQKRGMRNYDDYTLLRIGALEAHRSGYNFYEEAKNVWLSDIVPIKYIEFIC